jgi:hypothetical protein
MRTRYTLWGWTGQWPEATQPLPIAGGNLRDCRTRQRQFCADYPDALCGIYVAGDDPEGLTLQVKQRIGGES